MRQALSSLVLLLLFGVALSPAAEEFKDSKSALMALNDYVGKWNGDGKSGPLRKKESWRETIEWGWQFKGKDSWMHMKFNDSKIFKSGDLRYNLDKEAYQATLVNATGQKVVLAGNVEKGYLTLEGDDTANKRSYRLKINLAGGGDRMVYTWASKPIKSRLFRTAYQVAAARDGAKLSASQRSQRECVVSGGLGTSSTTYKGKTYWLCCSGCASEFKADPEYYIKEFEKRKKKR